MKRKMRSFAALFAATTIMLGAMPSTAMADDNYTVYNNTAPTVPENNPTAQGAGTYIGDADAHTNLGDDAILTKSLVIEEDANIPAATFTYEISSPAYGSGYTGNDQKYVVKSSDSNSTVSVFRGINVHDIGVKIYDAGDKNASAALTGEAVTSGSVGYGCSTAPGGTNGLYDETQTITLVYHQQQVKRNDGASPNGTTDKSSYIITENATDDDVFIVDANNGTNRAAYEYYTANKSMLLDFTKCAFPEPGIYRYTITEGGTNSGITNDTTAARTLDVYVEHVDDTPNNTLKVTGYVLYTGVVTGAPKSADATGTYTNVSVDGSSNVTANGAEVANEDKSTGWKNEYTTSNLTIGKKVEGNQGSKDKFFKYTIKLKGKEAADNYTVEVSQLDDETSATVRSSGNDGDTNFPNSATKYTNDAIYDGNRPTSYTVNGTTETEIVLYLRNGEYATLKGLPQGTYYSVTEDYEDYNCAYYGDFDTDSSDSTKTGIKDLVTLVTSASAAETEKASLAVAANQTKTAISSAAIAETAATANDAEYAFLNKKAGVIPTGIIMSVAPAIVVGLGVLAAIFGLILGGKKKELEEE